MWIKAEQLKASLNKGLQPIYFLSGDEPLQLGEAADLVRQAARKQGYLSREVLTVEGQFSWLEFSMAANSLSIFAEKKIIDLRIPNSKVGAEGSKALVQYCQDIPADTLLLITVGKIDKSAKKSKWVTNLESQGIALQIWPLEGAALLAWLQQRLMNRGLRVDKQGLALIAARVEGNLLAAAQEVEKLYSLYGECELSFTQLNDVVMDCSRYDVFNLVDAALSGRVPRVMKILTGLEAEGIAAPIVLWGLAREARNLMHIKRALAAGENSRTVFMKYQVWDKRQKLVEHVLKKLSNHDLMAILVMAAKTDRQIKGLEKGSSWQSLLEMSVALAGKNKLIPALLR